MSEPAFPGLAVGRYAGFVETVEEGSEGPLAVCGSLDEGKPFLVQAHGQSAFDLAEAADASIVHEHQALVAEGVAVRVAKVPLGGRAHVCEDERGRRLGRDPRQVDAVPCWDRRGEDAGLGAEGWRGVVADTEAVAVVWTAAVLGGVSRVCVIIKELLCGGTYQTKARVKGLSEDGVRGV